jgi:hypothetical protein
MLATLAVIAWALAMAGGVVYVWRAPRGKRMP